MQANPFPKISGVDQFKYHAVTPKLKVEITDTPYTVPSHGLTAEWYCWSTYTPTTPSFTSTYKVWQSTTPILKWFYGKSYPPEISVEYANTKQYGVRYAGYFQATAVAATLMIYGNGNVFAKLNTTAVATQSIGVEPNRQAILRITGLVVGNWYPLTIRYWSNDKSTSSDNVLVGLWKDSTLPHYIPISAGYFVSTNDYATYAGFVTRKTLPYIQATQLGKEKNQTSKFTFTIPVVSTSAPFGYKYDPVSDSFIDVDDPTITIKKFRKVDYSTGYYYSGSTTYTERFSGQVRGWRINKGEDGNVTAEIECYDWTSFLSDSINTGYPNVSDYITHIYEKRATTGVAYSEQPRCYDAWELNDAISNLLINSYVDPKLLVQKSRVKNVAGSIVAGKYLMFDRNLTNTIKLDRNFKYGNPLSINPDQADEAYIWQFSIGDRIQDNIQKIVDNYGLRSGFNELGYYFIESVGNPVTVKAPEKMAFTGSWTEDISADALYAYSKYSTTIGNKAVATFTGIGCSAVFGITSGVSGTVHFKLSNTTLGMIATFNYRLRHNKTWKFFNGVDPSLGYNPAIVNIPGITSYGLYSLNMTVKLGRVNVNSVLGYSKNYNDSQETFNTFGSEQSLIIDNMNYTSMVDNIRNDVLVVGRLKGVNAGLSLNAEEKDAPVNPNNPVGNNVVARAVDRASIGSLSSSNYVGRPLQTIIIEPKIFSEERAGWVATETVNRFNEYQKAIEPAINIIGHPLLEVGDYVKIKDTRTNTLATLHNFWINSVTEIHGENGLFTTSLGLESFKPWNSYYKYPTPSLKKFNNSVFYNLRCYNTGVYPQGHILDKMTYTRTSAVTTGTIYTSYYRDTTNKNLYNLLQTDFNNLIPPKGFIKINTEVIKYTNRNSTVTNLKVTPQGSGNLYRVSGSIYFKGLVRGEYNTTELSHATLLTKPIVDCGVSSYGYDEFGVTPGIEFDLLYPGFVKVSVEGQDGNLVDILTGDESPSRETGWVFANAGRNYFFSWGMIDRLGVYNETNSGQYELSGGSTDTPGVSNSSLDDWELFGPYWARYTVSSGYYGQNTKFNRFGTFNVILEYRSLDQSIPKESDIISSPSPIYISRRGTGSGVNQVTGGIGEELNIGYNTTLSTSGIGTIWFNSSTNQRVGVELNKTLRQSYTGIENSGQGALFSILNRFNNKRIAKISVTRYIFPIYNVRYQYRSYGPGGLISESPKNAVYVSNDAGIDDYIVGDNFTWIVDGTSSLSVNLTTPAMPFCPPSMRRAIDEYFLRQELTTPGNYLLHDVKSIFISHLHIIHIRATDQNGYSSDYLYPIFWVDPNIAPTNIASTKVSFYDVNKLYDFGRIQQKGIAYTGSAVINSLLHINLPSELQNKSKIFGNYILTHYSVNNEYKGTYVNINNIFGVQIYGNY